MPLDWSRRDGRHVSLPVVRHLASHPARRLGSLFVNGGGATGSAELVKTDGARLDALGGGRFDVIGWDLRGTGGSRVERCFDDQRKPRPVLGRVADPHDESAVAALRAEDGLLRAAVRSLERITARSHVDRR